MPDSSAEREPVEVLAEEFVARRRRGETPALSEYVARYPHLADEIRELFPTLIFLEEIDPRSTDLSRPRASAAPALLQVGNYRILRQLGAGGMGVVYEAEQLSLQRRVALKVLSSQVLGDGKARERFRHEARSAARLHHTNIVPVYEVGQEGEVCYYAMQLIPGQGLDQVVRELRRLRNQPPVDRNGDSSTSEPSTLPAVEANLPDTASRVAQSLLSGQFALPISSENLPGAVPTSPPSSSPGLGWSSFSSSRAGDRPYYRSVARIGQQTALALAYAHDRGIVHRDVKPSNLLLDEAGVVWVTDFGLAKTVDDNLTRTGELPGTLRYMAPERFEGTCDGRADVYALGLTLYELLVLEPAFAASDRLHLMDHVRNREPPRPRALDRRVPRDLETIVLKAIEKDPRRRYPSADELAEDLRRFLADEPIRARRTSWRERSWRWCRRNPAAALLILVSLATLASLGAALGVARFNARLSSALDEADRQRQKGEQLLYLNKITLAGREWADGDVSRTEQLLAECPAALRGWEWHFLRRHCHLEMQTLRDNPQETYDVAYSPDGRLLASCGKDSIIRLRDAATYRPEKNLKVSGITAFRCVRFSPDGRLVVAGSYQGVVCIWDVASGEEVIRLQIPALESSAGIPPTERDEEPFVPSGAVRHLAFSPRGDYLAAGTWTYGQVKGNGVVLYETAGWRMKRVYPADTNSVLAVGFDPAGQQLLAVFGSSTLNSGATTFAEFRAWSVVDGRQLQALHWSVRGASEAALSPNGRYVAASGADGTIHLKDRQDQREICTFTAHSGSVVRLAFSADSQRLGSCGDDRRIHLWEVASGRELAVLRGHGAWVNNLAFHPGGRWLASASDDGTVRLWDTHANHESRLLQGPADIGFCVPLDDSRWFVLGTDEPTARRFLWDARSRRKLVAEADDEWTSIWWMPHPALLSGDGHWFVNQVDSWAGLRKQRVTCIWDLETRKEPYCLRDAGGRDHVGRGAFDPTSRHLAILLGERPAAVQLVDVATGQPVWTRTAEDGTYLALAFTPDGGELAVLWRRHSPSHSCLLLLDADSGRERRRLPDQLSMFPPLVFAPDGSRLASRGQDSGTVQFLDLKTGQAYRSSMAHRWMVTTLAFSPDGTRLASGSHDHTIKVWDTATGEETLTLGGHRSPVTRVWFSADGHRLMSCDHAGELRTWDATPYPSVKMAE